MAARSPLVLGSDGLAQQLQQPADAFFVGAFTVATLPTAGLKAGCLAFATNGRALNTTASLANIAFEAAGSGTGVLVSWNGAAWKVSGTNSTVQA